MAFEFGTYLVWQGNLTEEQIASDDGDVSEQICDSFETAAEREAEDRISDGVGFSDITFNVRSLHTNETKVVRVTVDYDPSFYGRVISQETP